MVQVGLLGQYIKVNKKMNIFSKELLNKKNTLPSGTVLFDSSTAGTSNVTIPMTMVYDVIMVGAGGGGDKGAIYTSYGGGGSGAAYVGKLKLTAGTVSITVGAGVKTVIMVVHHLLPEVQRILVRIMLAVEEQDRVVEQVAVKVALILQTVILYGLKERQVLPVIRVLMAVLQYMAVMGKVLRQQAETAVRDM